MFMTKAERQRRWEAVARELREALQGATPGPWDTYHWSDGWHLQSGGQDIGMIHMPQDARLIRLLVEATPGMIELIDTMFEQVALLEQIQQKTLIEFEKLVREAQ